MNASEETKCGPSVVAETLRSLSEQAKVCHDKIDLLEAGQCLNRADVLAEVGKLLDACQNLRDAILSEDGGASWTTKNELNTVVSRLDDAASKRRRYLDLAQVLAAGTISHRRERTRLERMALRDKAVAELMEISEKSAPPELPGPAIENWLEWACGLEDEANEPELLKLRSGFPRLDDFVRQLEIDWWHVGSAPEAVERASNSAVFPASTNGSNGAHLNGNGNGKSASKPPVVEEEQPVAATPDVEVALIEAPVIEEIADSVEPDGTEAEPPALSSDSAAPSFDAEQVVELPEETLSPSKKGKISFFPWEMVDQFTRRIKKANVERKDARTIRALLAVSHWLEPRDQNPMTHVKCGIRALTGYPPTTEPVYVAPSDVTQYIAQDDGLPLLTGGADCCAGDCCSPQSAISRGSPPYDVSRQSI